MPLQQFTYRRRTYFVDYRLRQFRSVTDPNHAHPCRPDCRAGRIEFVDFKSDKGDAMLCRLIRTGQADWSRLHL